MKNFLIFLSLFVTMFLLAGLTKIDTNKNEENNVMALPCAEVNNDGGYNEGIFLFSYRQQK